jgi:hypothetical protein
MTDDDNRVLDNEDSDSGLLAVSKTGNSTDFTL